MNAIYEEIRIALHAIWQRRWLALAVAWGIAISGWLVVALIPNSYESTSRIRVQQQSVLTNEIGVTEREQQANIQRIRQTLASTANLERVVRQTDLAQQATTPEQVASLAASLRENVTVTAEQNPDSFSGSGNMFVIATRWSGGGFSDANSARIARQINQKLIDVFVEQNLAGSRAETTQSVEFLDRQIADRERRLQEIDQRRTRFESQFSGLLPGVGTISQRMDQARSELRNVEADLAAAQSSLSAVQGQMAGTSATVSTPGTYVPGGAAGPATARLNALQSQLADAQARGWTDQHPDVAAMRSQIARARAQAAGESGGGGQTVGGTTTANPLYMSLRSMLAERQATVAALASQRNRLRAAMNEIDQQQASNPGALAEQQQIERDYQAIQAQYNELVADRERVRLRGDVASETDVNTFNVVDPPSIPTVPKAPNRPLLLILVLMAAIAGGIGAAFAKSQLHMGYPTARRLGESTGLPVLGAISEMLRPSEIGERRRQLRRFVGGSAALFGVFVLLVAVEFIQRGMVA